MPDVQVYRVHGPARRRVGRALERLAEETGLAVATVEARAEVEAAIVDGIGYVGIRALNNTAVVSQVEQSLALAVPHASGRLATIADVVALGMADVAASAGRRIAGR